MKTKNRRFSITQREAEVIKIALKYILGETERILPELTPREKMSFYELEEIYKKLDEYKWIIEV